MAALFQEFAVGRVCLFSLRHGGAVLMPPTPMPSMYTCRGPRTAFALFPTHAVRPLFCLSTSHINTSCLSRSNPSPTPPCLYVSTHHRHHHHHTHLHVQTYTNIETSDASDRGGMNEMKCSTHYFFSLPKAREGGRGGQGISHTRPLPFLRPPPLLPLSIHLLICHYVPPFLLLLLPLCIEPQQPVGLPPHLCGCIHIGIE